jgi:hypothetical protein
MHGEMSADFTAMPIQNMITLFIGFAILLIITAVVINWLSNSNSE